MKKIGTILCSNPKFWDKTYNKSMSQTSGSTVVNDCDCRFFLNGYISRSSPTYQEVKLLT